MLSKLVEPLFGFESSHPFILVLLAVRECLVQIPFPLVECSDVVWFNALVSFHPIFVNNSLAAHSLNKFLSIIVLKAHCVQNGLHVKTSHSNKVGC